MITEWKLWACANHMVKEHGQEAVTKAGERLLDMMANNDMQAYLTWVAIIQRTVKLLQKRPGAGDTVQ